MTHLVLDECLYALLIRDITSHPTNSEEPTMDIHNVKSKLVKHWPQTNENKGHAPGCVSKRSLQVTRVFTLAAAMLLVAMSALLECFVVQKTRQLRSKTSQTSILLSGMACTFGLNKLFARWQISLSTLWKDFQREFVAVGAGSELMAKSDRSSQKSILRRRK